MNIPNQQRWRSLFRVRPLARRFHPKPIFHSNSVVSLPRLGVFPLPGNQPGSKASKPFQSRIILSTLRDIPLQPHYDFQQFCLVIIWRLIAQYTYIAGDTS
ncbi:hypothetical protein [Planktothrix sp. PCC 11201]|uniref:hypothetical protein n=1 Tax=Planktothrix sp. PCC 11201 TaxID=1729650 RepID=UPI0009A6B11F|nr:hypothetical protein [Planktothrix sp. PCC 11201]